MFGVDDCFEDLDDSLSKQNIDTKEQRCENRIEPNEDHVKK